MNALSSPVQALYLVVFYIEASILTHFPFFWDLISVFFIIYTLELLWTTLLTSFLSFSKFVFQRQKCNNRSIFAYIEILRWIEAARDCSILKEDGCTWKQNHCPGSAFQLCIDNSFLIRTRFYSLDFQVRGNIQICSGLSPLDIMHCG